MDQNKVNEAQAAAKRADLHKLAERYAECTADQVATTNANRVAADIRRMAAAILGTDE